MFAQSARRRLRIDVGSAILVKERSFLVSKAMVLQKILFTSYKFCVVESSGEGYLSRMRKCKDSLVVCLVLHIFCEVLQRADTKPPQVASIYSVRFVIHYQRIIYSSKTKP